MTKDELVGLKEIAVICGVAYNTAWRWSQRPDFPQPAARLSGGSVWRREDIDRWAGMWVAVKDGEVIAAAHNSRELVPMVRSKGESGRGAVAQFVPQRSDEIMIGVG